MRLRLRERVAFWTRAPKKPRSAGPVEEGEAGLLSLKVLLARVKYGPAAEGADPFRVLVGESGLLRVAEPVLAELNVRMEGTEVWRLLEGADAMCWWTVCLYSRPTLS